METKGKQRPQGSDGNAWKQLTSAVSEMYHYILSSKPNRLMLTADLTAADIAVGFPVAGKALYEMNLHSQISPAPYLDPIIILSSTLVSGAIAFYIYDRALYKLSKLKRSGKNSKEQGD
ncbi:MAG: hypothetical protein ACP5MZ_02315 [Candidatus Micrarchaeia archaeon]